MKNIKQFIQITDGLAEPLRRGFLKTIEKYSVHMTKEEAVEFAEKYLADRRIDGKINPEDPFWTWKVATEYVLLDIIPHLYGEALD